jgi:Integrase zinc binding domain/Integrase core domain
MTMLPEALFVRVIDTDLRDLLAEKVMGDDLMKEIVRVIKSRGTPPIRSSNEDWTMNKDNLVFFKDRCYVPQNKDLCRKIVQRYHENMTTGHPGRFQTLELVRRDYWWPGMTVFVRNYVEGCAACQQMKVNMHPTMPPISPIKSEATRPWSLVTMDFITDLPPGRGSDSIMVVVDHGLTKGVIFIPCNKTIDALGAADLYLEHVFRRFGLPDRIISDRDPRFASNLFQELGKLLGIKLSMSTAYHPQTDGATE